MEQNDYVQANRAMWNETAGVHAEGYVKDLLKRIAAPDFTTFDAVERAIFEEIGLTDKAVAQLSCNNGRELISCKKAGAGRCVGFDISDAFIAQARQLVQASGVEATFVCSDVYAIPAEYVETFDIVYVTIGALGWLPDLKTYFEIVAGLLKKGGHFFLYEMHPILNMFDAKKGLVVDASYFRTEPFVDEDEPDYMDPSKTVSGTSYWFPHTLADVIGGCLRNGLTLTHFEEYAHDISNVYRAFQDFEKKPPLSYSLVAQKTGELKLTRLS